MSFPTDPRIGTAYGPAMPAPAPAPTRLPRLPLLRPQRGRWLAGVCKGVSLHLGIPAILVRLLFVLTSFLFGAGLLAYVFLWVFVPAGDPFIARAQTEASLAAGAPLSRGNARLATDDTAQSSNASQPTDAAADTPHDESLADTLARIPKQALVALAGTALIALAILLMLAGFEFSVIAPVILAFVGVGVAWIRFDQPDRQLPMMLAGIALIFGAYAWFVMLSSFPGWGSSPRRIILAGLAMLGFAGLAVVPWAGTMLRNLTTERALKEREEERADMTAHLHDGVLQTLALIQLHVDQPETVFALARGQERELREWLYQTRTTSDRSVGAGLKDIAAHVEDEHGRAIEVVIVGDARPSAATDALLDATQQALVNAVTHGGEPVSVYCEAGANQIDIYVRDHGDGFDIEAIPADRLGIRESIIGRVHRRGGTVEIVSRPGWGTEVRMHMPVAAVGGDHGPQTSEGANPTGDAGHERNHHDE